MSLNIVVALLPAVAGLLSPGTAIAVGAGSLATRPALGLHKVRITCHAVDVAQPMPDHPGGSTNMPLDPPPTPLELAPMHPVPEPIISSAPPLPFELVPTTEDTKGGEATIPPMAFELVPVVQVDEAESAEVSVPSMSELIKFCLPTLGIWLSAPLLSLIDTSIVGLHSAGVAQLAALAPSTKLCDYVAFFCTVIGAATTNLAADAFAVGQPGRAKAIVGSSLTVGLGVGVLVAVAMAALAGPAMGAMLGTGACPVVLGAATSYTAIRAIGYPAALLTMVLQAGFVASKDTQTPLLAVPIVASVNLLADLLLVGPMQMGAAGAAWATTGALYANAIVLLALWRKKMRSLSGEDVLFKRPTSGEVRALIKFAAPMMVALCARVYMGLSMTLSAVALGTTALAANQVIDSLYWLFCPLGEGMSLCMQAYLPKLLLRGRSLARRLQRATLGAAAGLGLFAAAGAAALPVFGSGMFTTSAPVVATMASAAPALAFALGAYVLACTTEGMLIARKELRFLAATHALNTAALTLVLARIVRWPGCGLRHIWALFGVCNALRLVEFSFWVRRSDERAVADSQEWRRQERPMRHRVRELRRQRRQTVEEAIPDIAAIDPNLLGFD